MINQFSRNQRSIQSSPITRAHRPRIHRFSSRQGTLVVCVLVCLLVVASLAGATTHAALRWRRSIRLDRQMLQTELLLDAGILRAAKQLRSSADYRGETWRPSRESVGFESPMVEIQVTRRDDPATHQVKVVAQLGTPLSELQRTISSHTRRSHTFSVPIAADSQDSDPSSVE